jgi:hypothetical protein
MILKVPFRHVLVNKGQMIFLLAVTNQRNQVLVMNPCQVLSLQYSFQNFCSDNLSRMYNKNGMCSFIYKTTQKP